MQRITPESVYQGLPCSMTALGCAMGLVNKEAIKGLKSPHLTEDGYLSLRAMDDLIRANVGVKSRTYYTKDARMKLRDFAHRNEGKKAIICLLGHYVYFDGHDYHSFYWNGNDPVVQVWYLKEESE